MNQSLNLDELNVAKTASVKFHCRPDLIGTVKVPIPKMGFSPRLKTFLALVLFFLLSNLTVTTAQPQVPQWAVNLYMTDSTKLAPTKNLPNMFAPKAVEIIFFRQLSDSASYCIYKADNGVCVLHYLATQRNRKTLAELQIADACEADNSSINYSSESFQLDSIINVISCSRTTEIVSPEFITNDGQLKRFKPGFNRTNAVITRTETTRQIKITDSGIMEEYQSAK